MMNYLNSWGLWINLGYFEAYCWIFNFITIIKIHLCFITEHYYKLMEIVSFLDNLDQQKIQSSQNWRKTGSTDTTAIKSEEYHCFKINVSEKGQRVVWIGLYYSYINCFFIFQVYTLKDRKYFFSLLYLEYLLQNTQFYSISEDDRIKYIHIKAGFLNSLQFILGYKFWKRKRTLINRIDLCVCANLGVTDKILKEK